MKKLLATSVLSFALFLSAAGQETSEKLHTSGGGGMTIGYGNMDVSVLQAFLPAGTRKLKNDHIVIGGTGHGYIGRLVIGGSGFGMIGDKLRNDSLEVSLGGGVGTFDLGYLVLDREQVKLFPMIGIGGGGYGLSIAKNRNVSVDDVLKDPGQEININRGAFVADVSVNLNLIPFLEYDEQDNSYGGFMTGCKVGYLYSLPSSNWNFTGGDITGGPDFGLNMFYVKLIIGGFGYQNNRG